MKIDPFCTNGTSPPFPPSSGESSDPSTIGTSSESSHLNVDQVPEQMRKRIRKLSYLGLHPETIRREIEAESAIIAQALLASQAKRLGIERDESLRDEREVCDLKVGQIEDNRFYSNEQIERSFKSILNLETLRQNGMVTRGGWTYGASLRQALERIFSKDEGSENSPTGGINGEGNPTPRLRSQASEKRMARNLRGTNKKRGMVQPSGGSTGGLENELENLKRLRKGKSAVQA